MRLAGRQSALLVYLGCLAVMVGAAWIAAYTQCGFGTIEVTNVTYPTETGISMRAKQFRPIGVSDENPAPGVVCVHGYQNNRETSDPFGIELARRGVVVIDIDALGRGNSGRPLPVGHPGFDKTFGAKASIFYLKGLGHVDPGRIGIMGHSMGASFAYETALEDSNIGALVLSGFVFDERASASVPRNMLTIFGTYDELRERMTHTADVATEWLKTDIVARVFGHRMPIVGRTYGDFEVGTARQVLLPPLTHLAMTHHRIPIAAAVKWMRAALRPDAAYWIDPSDQIWWVKEIATLVALIACLFSAMPLGVLFLRWRFFASLVTPISYVHTVTLREAVQPIAVNTVLMGLYLPLCLVIHAVHAFVVPIDRPFPMMIVNGIVCWLFIVSVVGFYLFRRWQAHLTAARDNASFDLGIPELSTRYGLVCRRVGKALLLGAMLFLVVYATEYVVEQLFIIDLRFIFPFASDLTLDRALIYPRYVPFLLFSFWVMGLFLHVRLRRPPKGGRLITWFNWSIFNTAVLVLPLVLLLAIQYGSLSLFGIIPFEGPGGAFASLTMNLFHLFGILVLVVPIATWYFQITGQPYVGAALSAAIVTWILVSSQVIAAVPI